jgi:aurora kinase
LNKLGEGKFGKVFLVREINTGFVMAMKVLEKKKIIQDNILEQFIRELKIQAFLNHPNIIDVYGFFHDEHYFYTLLELGCDGQLYNIIAQHKNLTE